jgi:hypothetical protein
VLRNLTHLRPLDKEGLIFPLTPLTIIVWTLRSDKKGKPEAATSGFEGELRRQLEAQRAYLFLPWLLTVCKALNRTWFGARVGGHFYFAPD